MDVSEQIKLWARELKSISQTGLEYGKDVFDKERYNQINELSNHMLSSISKVDVNEINRLLPIESGYATPKIAVRGIVLKDGQLLMVKEAADGLWTPPGGWCDVGLTPAENVEKEILEETGLKAKACRLLSFFDQTKYRSSVTLQHIYTVYILCEIVGGKLIDSSIETDDVRFFDTDDLPPLSTERVTTIQLEKALSIAMNKEKTVHFD